MPSMIVVVSIGFAVALIEVDAAGSDRWLARWPLMFGAGAEGARGMMSTIAGSMMTVVGVTFSMILVVLALASSQYTSRILRNFMRSRVTQGVLGIFAGIFTYCLIVLRTIRGGVEGTFVPSLAVFFGFVLALGGVGALMFFIHHIASSIQASSIIASVAQDTIAAIDRLFPETLGQGPGEDEDEQTLRPMAERNWHAVPAKESGYIQSVNNAALLGLARDRKTIVWMEHGIGEFVVQNTKLASLAMEDPPDQDYCRLASDFQHQQPPHVGTGRGLRHQTDRGCGVESALSRHHRHYNGRDVRGLSDGNSARIATRRIPSSRRYEEGELRVIAKGPSFESLLAKSFDQMRRIAKGDVAIMSRMLDPSNPCQFDGQPTPPAGDWRTSAMDRRAGRAHRRVRP